MQTGKRGVEGFFDILCKSDSEPVSVVSRTVRLLSYFASISGVTRNLERSLQPWQQRPKKSESIFTPLLLLPTTNSLVMQERKGPARQLIMTVLRAKCHLQLL